MGVPPVRNVTDPQECYNTTVMDFQAQLDGLGVDAVDLMMLHGPGISPERPFGIQGPCGDPSLNLAQWRAYSDMYKAGKAKAIGVSNYCQSCLEPLITDPDTPVPAVNQVQFHIGMGPDPEGLPSFLQDHGIAMQAYSPLSQGDLVKNTETVNIGSMHNRSGAQTALRWITQHGHNFVVQASSVKHLAEDADTFGWDLTDSELAQLDAVSCTSNPELCQQHSGTPSWGCTLYHVVTV